MLHGLTHRHEHEDALPPSHPVDGAATASKGPRRLSSGLKFFSSSATRDMEPTATPPHKRWEKNYIRDLRINRPARPSGSRPLPDRGTASPTDQFARATSALSFRPSVSAQQAHFTGEAKERSVSALSHRGVQSDMPKGGPDGTKIGKKNVREQKSTRNFSASTRASKATLVSPRATYRESGMRWMEKQEARSLREALEDMDSREEAKLHAAAQNEATELVRKHRNGRDQGQVSTHLRNYREHLQKGAHARSQSQAWNGTSVDRVAGSRTVSGKSTSTASGKPITQEDPNISASEKELQPEEPRSHMEWDSPQKKAYMNLTFPFELRRTSVRRRSSGPRARDVGGGLFRNPEDKIYAEPSEASKQLKSEDSAISKIPLSTKARNTASKIQTASQPFLRSRQTFAEDKKPGFRSEIHRNPPSRSRNPSYTTNNIPLPLEKGNFNQKNGDLAKRRMTREGMEIRSDDIRAATSMRMKDQSPKLPSPTVVSGRPDRPIVSFTQGWEPKNTEKNDNVHSIQSLGILPKLRHKPHMPESTASAPIIPTITVPEPPSINVNPADDVFGQDTSQKPRVGGGAGSSLPSISVSDALIPSISLPDDSPTSRPLPDPSIRAQSMLANRPLPHHSSTAPVYMSTPHWSVSDQRATAQCAACALSIAGRIVSAASLRFHPHCFTCHHCSEPLECVAFYPEPDRKREERLARIEARDNGNYCLVDIPGETAIDDGDPSLRFYCHLDFHEFFSPRCKSCKTPIESEVVVACGSTWHVGHFFCAECGDPFDPKTPFLEKDGYAWCVDCHAGKFSGKCKGCRKPVVTKGIRALDADWHEECFICFECRGPFEDGRFFTRETDPQRPVCVGCEERRLKA